VRRHAAAHFVEAQAEQELWQELHDHGASLNQALDEEPRIHSGPEWRVFQVSGFSSDFVVSSPAFFRIRAFPNPFSSCLARRWQDLERQARERYDTLDRLDADLNWYQGQYNTLDALAEALRSPDRWLVYGAEALLDQPPEQDAQAAGDASAVEKVRTTRCAERAKIWRGHAPSWWRGRPRSPPLAPNSNRTARRSRGRGPGRVRPRRGPRKLRS
jgi:hypothetical protein